MNLVSIYVTLLYLVINQNCIFQITELNLDNCRSPNIAGLTDEFINLETLSLMNVGLTSLKGFPKLPNLKKVYVYIIFLVRKIHLLMIIFRFRSSCTNFVSLLQIFS